MSDLAEKIKDLCDRYASISEQWQRYRIDKEACLKELETVAIQNGWEVRIDDVELHKMHNLLTPPDFFSLLGVGDLSNYDECWILPKEMLVQTPLVSNVNSIIFFLTTKSNNQPGSFHAHPVYYHSYKIYSPRHYTFKGELTYKDKGIIVCYNTRSKVLQIEGSVTKHRFPNHMNKLIDILNNLVKNTLINNYNSIVDEDSLTRDIFTSTYKYLKKLGVVE